MGLVAASFAQTANSESWAQLGRGPKLRQIFGAYLVQDCWAVQRRFRQLDDGSGFVGFDEFSRLVGAEEFSLLFVWDLFSKQNELLDVTELLTMVCLFSSAPMEEKGRFLLALFDKAKCSICTGLEVAQLCTTVFGILARCTGLALPRMKEVSASLKAELPVLLKEYAEAAESLGTDAAFRSERVVHHSQVKSLLDPVRHAYERLPFSRPPPGDSPPPPPQNWGLSATAPARPAAAAASGPHGAQHSQAQSQVLEPHLAWMSRLEDDPLPGSAEPAVEEPHRCWVVMNDAEFRLISADLTGFRQTFVRAARAALALPADRVEVVEVTSGNRGLSTLLELLLYADATGADERTPLSLARTLEEQLRCAHSALRKGPFGSYLGDAELVSGLPERLRASPDAAAPVVPPPLPAPADDAAAAPTGQAKAGRLVDMAVQTGDDDD